MADQIRPSEISDVLLEQLRDLDLSLHFEEVGKVLQVSDGVVRIHGLLNAEAGELLEFEDGIKAVVMNLEEDNVGAVLLGPTDRIKEGMIVKRTGRIASINVSDEMVGRVVNPLGEPLDGKGRIGGDLVEMPLERKAPGVIFRQPVNEPLQTGLKAIDAMIPIGRGQRELIIGDRQTGKTAIAIDTIINQKGKDTVCIYVAIGQKDTLVAEIKEKLEAHGAMEYTTIIAVPASASAALQYIAPFSGSAMAEYFMYEGKDVLIVYDDLSKHAVAYRELSLLLHRPSGREAYPGDVFYLHSRLLERAAHLSDELGGGSITALPIIETLAGDISAYIPTNVISITDGQIFLDAELFNEGQRPAINVGLSVSRVGGAAQSPVMKKVSASLRTRLAQYRELASFAQFGSELDADTAEKLAQGERIREMLKQPQYAPMPVEYQIMIIFAATQKYLLDIPVEDVLEFEKALFEFVDTKYPDIPASIREKKELDDEIKSQLIKAIEECKKDFSK